jgi:hypothetical protein
MDRTSALIVAAILACGIMRALIRGDAAAGEGISRHHEPMAFWGIVSVAAVGLLVMLVIAWRG